MIRFHCVSALGALGLLFLLASSQSLAGSDPLHYYVPLDAWRVIPPTPSGGQGWSYVNVNAAHDSVSYVAVFFNLSSPRTAITIHPGRAWEVGPAVLTLAGSGGLADTLSGTVYLPPGLEPLFHGSLYMEVDTQAYPAGELRGPFYVDGIDPARAASWGTLRREYNPGGGAGMHY
jgi:hypothetical protein